MGIFCETDIQKPPGGVFSPGSPVSGVVRYAIENKTVDKIIISLKGTGRVHVDKDKRMDLDNQEVYINAATFVEIDENEKTYLNGRKYETQFTFVLPENIPSSMKFTNGKITCHVLYVVRIEFVIPGHMSFNKEFENEITVLSTIITPKLPVKPMIYGEKRKVLQLFRKNESIVNMKATIQNSVLRPGGKVEIEYQVDNNTGLDIKRVETRLIETFKCYSQAGYLDTENGRSIKELETKTDAIKKGDSSKMTLQINLPPELHSIEHCKVLARCYYVVITAVLPKFHFNVHVIIPIQIGDWLDTENVTEENQSVFPVAGTSHHDPPPNYWQAIGDLNSLIENEDSSGDNTDVKNNQAPTKEID